MIVLLWDSFSTQHRPSRDFSLALTLYCSLCIVFFYPTVTQGKSEIFRRAAQEATKPSSINHKIEDSLKQPRLDRNEYETEDEYIESYDSEDSDDFSIYDELTRTESLSVVEDSINVFAKDIGAAFSDLLDDDHDTEDVYELGSISREGDSKDIHYDSEHDSVTTDRTKVSIGDHDHSSHTYHPHTPNHHTDDDHSNDDHSDNKDHIGHDHSEHKGHETKHSQHNHSQHKGHETKHSQHNHSQHNYDDKDHIAHDHSDHDHSEHDHKLYLHHSKEEHITHDHNDSQHHDEEFEDSDLLIEGIKDERFFAKMGLNPTEVKRQYFGWLRNKQQQLEQTKKEDLEDTNNENHNHNHKEQHREHKHSNSEDTYNEHDHSSHKGHKGRDHSQHNHEEHEQGDEGHSHGGKGRELSELSSSVWFVASASILVISLVGVLSVGFLPLLSNERGEAILQAFICIAVGTLVGDSFIHLAPHALTHSHSPETTWKGFLASMVVMAFIALDKILSFIGMKHGHSHSTVITAFEPILKNDQDKDKLTDDSFSQSSTMMAEECGSMSNASILQGNSSGNVHSHGHGKNNTNLMVIIGDAIHNFADGIAIGAAFSIGYGPGLSTSIAVLCHELPHEIGDFAILIQNGMRIKTALFYNLVSSITGFLGMCLGMVMGSKGEYSSWMIAGIMGVFLYIALVSMLPEITAHTKTMMAVNIGGMVLGVVLLLVIGLYEEDLVYLLAV